MIVEADGVEIPIGRLLEGARPAGSTASVDYHANRADLHMRIQEALGHRHFERLRAVCDHLRPRVDFLDDRITFGGVEIRGFEDRSVERSLAVRRQRLEGSGNRYPAAR